MKPRIAVVGVGLMGKLHTNALSSNPRVHLACVVDTNQGRAEKIANEYNTSAQTSLKQAIREHSLDGVVIATPEQHHRQPTITCLDEGVNVLLEKPLAHNLEDGEAIVNAASSSNAKIQMGYACRFDPRYFVARQKIEDGELGDIVAVSASRRTSIEIQKHAGEWSHPLFYLSVHDLDLMRWLSGEEPTRIYAISSSKTLSEKPDVIYANIQFENNVIGALEVDWAKPSKTPSELSSNFYITGTKGCYQVNIENQGATLITEDGGVKYPEITYWPIVYGQVWGTVRSEHDHFIDWLCEGGNPVVNEHDGLVSLKMALAIMQSLKKNEPVDL